MVVPVTPAQIEYAEDVQKQLWAAGFYADVDNGGDQLNKKIRNAQLAQYNFILVVGGKEAESKTVNVRTRDNKQHGEKSISQMIEDLRAAVAAHE